MKLFYSMSLQDSMSPLMSHITFFHDHVMIIMIMILSSVLYLFFSIVFYPCFGRFFKSSEVLEGIWTVLPCFVLASLAAPSLMTLYLSDESGEPLTSVKIVGHQWYWSYEYGGEGGYSFDSYLVPSSSLNSGDNRLLEVDKSVFLPYGSEIRFIVSSSDVIHSWCVPSFGVKMDAVPGRINQFFALPSRVGVLYGQCSEICGSLHSFMPIKVEVVMFEDFIKLIEKLKF